MNNKAVIFDFDGTIADTNDIILESWQHTYMEITGKKEDPAVICGRFGEPLKESMEIAFPGVPVDKCIELYRGYQATIYEDRITLFPGVTELLEKLKADGYKVVLLTSRQYDFTMKGLDKFGIRNIFDAIVTCEDTEKHKPDPEPMYAALKKGGLEKENAVMIGDSRFDIMCAHRAGVKGALVKWSVAQPVPPEEGEGKPDYIIEKPEDILEIMK